MYGEINMEVDINVIIKTELFFDKRGNPQKICPEEAPFVNIDPIPDNNPAIMIKYSCK
jgi:hypothetical protein